MSYLLCLCTSNGCLSGWALKLDTKNLFVKHCSTSPIDGMRKICKQKMNLVLLNRNSKALVPVTLEMIKQFINSEVYVYLVYFSTFFIIRNNNMLLKQ